MRIRLARLALLESTLQVKLMLQAVAVWLVGAGVLLYLGTGVLLYFAFEVWELGCSCVLT